MFGCWAPDWDDDEDDDGESRNRVLATAAKYAQKLKSGKMSHRAHDYAELFRHPEPQGRRKRGLTMPPPGWDDSSIADKPPLNVGEIMQQKLLGAQSLRGWSTTPDYSDILDDEHDVHCFSKMLENEARNAGSFAVFYHSYSEAAILYELQGAIAAVLFGYRSTYGTLPRLLRGDFHDIPDAPAMLRAFPSWPEEDHNPQFKSVGICATTSLLHESDQEEAPPLEVFDGGYSIGSLSISMITNMLTACGLEEAEASGLAQEVLNLAQEYGLDVSAFGGNRCESGKPGHLLQIFMRRNLVDKYCYAAFPFGHIDDSRMPLGDYLMTNGSQDEEDEKVIWGQVRIVCHPTAFVNPESTELYTYSADPTFHAQRTEFQKKLKGLLKPVLGTADARRRAALGIFGGTLPQWFDPTEDHSDWGLMDLLPFERWK